MYHFFVRLTFVIGFVIGMFLACAFIILSNSNHLLTPKFPTSSKTNYGNWFRRSNLNKQEVALDVLRYGAAKFYLESQYLYDNIKILCVILVKSSSNADAAKNTWAKGCNDVKLVNLNVERNLLTSPHKKVRNWSWPLLCEALSTSDVFDWVLIVNDTTFAILENLRLMVAHLNATRNYYLGHAVHFWTTRYNAGQAGYALSLGSLNALKVLLEHGKSCVAAKVYLKQEDFYLGKLLASLDIFPQDTRDPLSLSTFHSFSWQQEFFTSTNYYKSNVYPVSCCSARSVTFQATQAAKMYTYYYLLYRLQVFTHGNLGNSAPSTPVPQEEVWKSFLKERGVHRDHISPREYYKIWEELVHDPIAFGREMQDVNLDYP